MTMTRSTLRAALAAVLAAGAWACESAQLPAPDAALGSEIAAAPVADPLGAQAATLQWLIDNKGIETFDAYCVATGFPETQTDPSPELLALFAGSTPPVVPASDCTQGIGGNTYNPTGGPAQFFLLGDPVITGRRATVESGFHVNGRFAEFFRCELILTGQGWRVRECVLTAAA